MNKKDRQKIFDKYNGRCAYCGCELKDKFQVDHLIPQLNFESHIKNKFKVPKHLAHLTLSDVNHIDNLMPACGSCNNWKNAFDIELFRSEIQEQIQRLNKYNSNYRIAKRYGLIQEIPINVKFYFELFAPA